MTIAVGVAAPDGMILAAESRTTWFLENDRTRVASDNAQKIFPICDSIGVAAYGDAVIGGRPISGLMDEFVSQLSDDDDRDAAAIASELGDFFDERYRAATAQELIDIHAQNGTHAIGFFVAGYDGDGIGRVRGVEIPGPNVVDLIDTADRGFVYRGQTDVIRRLLQGFDSDLFYSLGHELPDELLDPIVSLGYRPIYPITMQDAIDLGTFFIRTTIDMQRFSDGTFASPGEIPGCGGPIRVLAVTRDRAEWVAAPELRLSSSGVAEGPLAR